jgi:hypothetical protein
MKQEKVSSKQTTKLFSSKITQPQHNTHTTRRTEKTFDDVILGSFIHGGVAD